MWLCLWSQRLLWDVPGRQDRIDSCEGPPPRLTFLSEHRVTFRSTEKSKENKSSKISLDASKLELRWPPRRFQGAQTSQNGVKMGAKIEAKYRRMQIC